MPTTKSMRQITCTGKDEVHPTTGHDGPDGGSRVIALLFL